jgi:dihydrolipoamide dehydrogenase
MKEYDVIVIGSGCGMNIVEEALAHDLDVALVDKGPLGGTCPNTGEKGGGDLEGRTIQ